MKPKRAGSLRSTCQIETLESRTFLSGTPVLTPIDTGAGMERSAVVRDAQTAKAVTQTIVKATSEVLGKGTTFTVTVRAAAALGSPSGTISLLHRGILITTLTLTPVNSTNPKFAMATASYTIPLGGGGTPLYFGNQRVGAAFVSSGSMLPSKGYAMFVVKRPRFSLRPGHLRVGFVTPGSGPQIVPGQTANVLYTGYLQKDGTIFDDSTKDGGTPLAFTLEASPEQVVNGFDRGTNGMQAGETRVLILPPAIAYGAMGSGTSVPPGATLVFLITLESIS